LDTINLRKQALPVRYEYKDFYKHFQDLDGLSSNRGESYFQLESMEADFKTMTENVVKTCCPEVTNEERLYGTNKIFMSQEFFNIIQTKLEHIQRDKRNALDVMINAYKAWLFSTKWNKFRHRKVTSIDNAKQLFISWNSKIEYMRFKKLLRIIGRMQMNFRMTKLKRELRLHKYISNIIGRSYKFYRIRKIFMQANKLATCLNNCKKKILFRRFFIRVKKAREHVDWIFDHSWNNIMIRFRLESATAIQRTLRGHLDRMKAQDDLKQLEEIKRELAINRNVTFIQKWVRGY